MVNAHLVDDPTIRQPQALLFLDSNGLSWTVSAPDKVTAVPVRRNGNFQTPISVPAVRPKRCYTLSNPAHRQDYKIFRNFVPSVRNTKTKLSSCMMLTVACCTQRSATNSDYIVPLTHHKVGERAFSVAAPKAWNRLPTKLKTSTCSTDSFKRSLKTFLFQSVYGRETRVCWLL